MLKIWQVDLVQLNLFEAKKIEWSPEIEEAYKTHPGHDYAVNENGDTIDQVKWYDHGSDLIEHSKKYPNLVFQLYGEGEESGDIWCDYYHNGKCTHHAAMKWIPPEFDLKQLT